MQKCLFYSICVSERPLSFPPSKIRLRRSNIMLWPFVWRLVPIKSISTEAEIPSPTIPSCSWVPLGGRGARGAGRGADPLPPDAERPPAAAGWCSGRASRDQPPQGPKSGCGRTVSVERSSAAERSRSGFHPAVIRRWLQLPDTTALPGSKWIQMSGSVTLNTKMPCVRDAVK